MGDKVQVSGADGGGRPPGSRISPSDVPQFGCSDREGARQQGSCARVGIESSDRKSLGTDEEDKRSVVAQATAGVCSPSEKVLEASLLGTGVFLCDERPGDRGADQGIHRGS